MAMDDKIPPAGLHPQLVKKLLDHLQSDDAFRTQFQDSPEKALRSLGYTDPWDCMTLASGQKLASPEEIKAKRDKLEDVMGAIQGFTCPLASQQG